MILNCPLNTFLDSPLLEIENYIGDAPSTMACAPKAEGNIRGISAHFSTWHLLVHIHQRYLACIKNPYQLKVFQPMINPFMGALKHLFSFFFHCRQVSMPTPTPTPPVAILKICVRFFLAGATADTDAANGIIFNFCFFFLFFHRRQVPMPLPTLLPIMIGVGNGSTSTGRRTFFLHFCHYLCRRQHRRRSSGT